MDKHYDPARVEGEWYQKWLDAGVFHSDASAGGAPYCIVIPPPNVTGILHMGHALNNTIQDILIRWRKMQGRNTVWVPGTDHAGIATQNVVERALSKEGQHREDLGREAFVKRVWEWREEYGGTIIRQLKKLGAACDWERERFTMDEGLSDAVSEVFVRLFEKGLIYRANYIVNWCPRCQTALSDEESEHQQTKGKLYYIRYPVKSDGQVEYLVVATTRPETLLGDVAVAVNPDDERYNDLGKNRKIILPVLDRELAVIRDEFVDREFGTGIVKVTPAHDPNDFDMGRRHGLETIDVMNDDGTMNENAGPYAGMDRFECREKILEQLKKEGLLEKVEDHENAVGHCYRCDAVVEPRLSPQWFVKMKPLAEPAIEAVKSGKVEFVPKRWEKVYLEWMENIRDWCISRQIWWGHRIPIFTCGHCEHVWADKGQPDACPSCGKSGNVAQDEDVLDTWFSSWLWPFSTFGWPGKNDDLAFYYPTHDLVTASEIIFFWVARMIMAGLEFMGEVPFSKVYIHGTVRDDKGLKMSKSLGNSIDPLTIIEEFSADALRFSLIMITATGQDVFLSNDKFEIGRNFGTKLWNAARFMQMQREKMGDDKPNQDDDFDPALLGDDDRHILAKLDEAIRDCDDNFGKYRFNDAAHTLYEFVWHQYCDWYVEYTKQTFYGDDEERKRLVMNVMDYVFSRSLKLLHPMMPFVTEELWHAIGYATDDQCFLLCESWPCRLGADQLKGWGAGDEVVRYVDDKHDLVRAGRTLRSDYGVTPTQKIDYVIKANNDGIAEKLKADVGSLASLLRAEKLVIETTFDPKKATPSEITVLGTIYMPLEGLVDIEEERARQTAQLEKLVQDLDRVTAKLHNEGFVSKAPANVVNQQKERQKELLEKKAKLGKLIKTLGELEG